MRLKEWPFIRIGMNVMWLGSLSLAPFSSDIAALCQMNGHWLSSRNIYGAERLSCPWSIAFDETRLHWPTRRNSHLKFSRTAHTEFEINLPHLSGYLLIHVTLFLDFVRFFLTHQRSSA